MRNLCSYSDYARSEVFAILFYSLSLLSSSSSSSSSFNKNNCSINIQQYLFSSSIHDIKLYNIHTQPICFKSFESKLIFVSAQIHSPGSIHTVSVDSTGSEVISIHPATLNPHHHHRDRDRHQDHRPFLNQGLNLGLNFIYSSQFLLLFIP